MSRHVAARRGRAGRPGSDTVTVLLVWDLDRLSRRDLTDAQAELSLLRRDGVRYVVTAAQVYDLRDAMDRVMMAFQQELGKRAYVVSLARAVARGARERAMLGLWVAGPTPYGYKVGDSGKLTVEPAKAKV